ncbi:DUF4249 domain-containing protein [Spirosoma utsteinense]|uniref:DUF4249 domain-containing protein n=1 Tax=Spirosoma utsteinense TaxID=2585773 RepID=A0ABR6W8W9_9BACT|nr:DUF4249 domain-containing protein [Spirosoma utsteinense]MBC3787418.1 hypothetical protein [Spirosoma utsteinense]MBC3793027.1 hypothetical protein [Spirosoma utsteinense]
MNRFLVLALTFLASSCLFTSCQNAREEVQPVELTAQSGRLVVDCFISPQDTMLTAKVTRSRPVLDNNPLKNVEIKDALVKLTNGDKTVVLEYDAKLYYYRINAGKLPIRAGATYTLTVQTPDGNQVIAVSTVPQMVPLKSVRMDSSLTKKGDTTDQKPLSVICTWQNSISTTDRYQLQGAIQGILYESPKTAAFTKLSTIPFNMADNNLGLISSKPSDNLLSASAYVWDQTNAIAINNKCRSIEVLVHLLHVDEAYYRYHKALDQQLQASTNPFAEPVLIPSNIQGGLGCFGSYNRSSIATKLKYSK